MTTTMAEEPVVAANPPEAASAPAADDATEIETGRQALRKSADYPWYDRESDGVRRIEMEAPPPPPSNSTWSGFNWNFNWVTPLAWCGIAVMLSLLAWLMIRAYLARERRLVAVRSSIQETATTMVDRVEHLPVQIRRPRGDLLSEAREHYRNGNYREAIIYFYSHLLLELDKQQLIHLARGKTNRQYLRELATRQGLRGLLEQTMLTFEDVFFGDLAISRERFEACWNRLPDFNSLLQGGGA